jgi:hypothetical protein
MNGLCSIFNDFLQTHLVTLTRTFLPTSADYFDGGFLLKSTDLNLEAALLY